MARLLVLLPLLASGSPRTFQAFENLQVSSPLLVKVTVDESLKSPQLRVNADEQAMGWTVITDVFPTTFGPTLLVGMDGRASAQGFSWSGTSGQAELTVPRALHSISVADHAKVIADVATGDLAASENASLVVSKFDGTNAVQSLLFRASSGAQISVAEGRLQRALLQASGASEVNLENVSIEQVEIEVNKSMVTVNASQEVAITCAGGQVRVLGNATVTENSPGCTATANTELPGVIIP